MAHLEAPTFYDDLVFNYEHEAIPVNATFIDLLEDLMDKKSELKARIDTLREIVNNHKPIFVHPNDVRSETLSFLRLFTTIEGTDSGITLEPVSTLAMFMTCKAECA